MAQQQRPPAAIRSAVSVARSAVSLARSAVSVARSAVYVPAAALLFLVLISSLAKTSVATPIVVKQSTDPRDGKPCPRLYYSIFCKFVFKFLLQLMRQTHSRELVSSHSRELVFYNTFQHQPQLPWKSPSSVYNLIWSPYVATCELKCPVSKENKL